MGCLGPDMEVPPRRGRWSEKRDHPSWPASCPEVTQDRGCAVQCSALLHVSLQFPLPLPAAGSRDHTSGGSCAVPFCRLWDFVWGALQAPYLFLRPIRLSLLSVWRESMFRVLVDTGRQPMGSALHYSLMGGACVSDDEMCLRKRSARGVGFEHCSETRP